MSKTLSQSKPYLNQNHISIKTLSQSKRYLNQNLISIKTLSQSKPYLNNEHEQNLTFLLFFSQKIDTLDPNLEMFGRQEKLLSYKTVFLWKGNNSISLTENHFQYLFGIQ